jgi:hypothetical protein
MSPSLAITEISRLRSGARWRSVRSASTGSPARSAAMRLLDGKFGATDFSRDLRSGASGQNSYLVPAEVGSGTSLRKPWAITRLKRPIVVVPNPVPVLKRRPERFFQRTQPRLEAAPLIDAFAIDRGGAPVSNSCLHRAPGLVKFRQAGSNGTPTNSSKRRTSPSGSSIRCSFSTWWIGPELDLVEMVHARK